VGLSLAPRATTTTTLSSDSNPAIVGETVTITASVAAASGTPTGTVQFAVNGVDQGAPVALVDGEATFTFTPPLGAHVITAAYAGDNSNLPSSGTLTQRVTYDVVFLSPTRPEVNTGATIPVRVALLDASGNRISDAAALALGSCGVNISASGAQTLAGGCATYDSSADQFGVNLRTERNGGRGLLTISAAVTAGSPTGTVTSTLGVTLVR
jgi:hypothetical protein